MILEMMTAQVAHHQFLRITRKVPLHQTLLRAIHPPQIHHRVVLTQIQAIHIKNNGTNNGTIEEGVSKENALRQNI